MPIAPCESFVVLVGSVGHGRDMASGPGTVLDEDAPSGQELVRRLVVECQPDAVLEAVTWMRRVRAGPAKRRSDMSVPLLALEQETQSAISRERSMRMLTRLPLLTMALVLVAALPAEASGNGTVVTHGSTHTEFFPDDICGPRASTVTFTATVSQSKSVVRDGTFFSYRDVAVVTYDIDFVDPALADYSGSLTEVNHFILTPGENTFIVTNTYRDIGGDLKIWERLNIKVVDGEVVVDRGILKVTGCP